LIGPIASTGIEIQKPGKPKEDTILALDKRLIEQQKDVSARRLQVRESRTALRHKRDEVSELRSEWMEQLNAFFARLDHVDEELLRGFKHLWRATEEQVHMESSYHQEEDQLEEEEYMLTLSMESFAALSGSGSSPINPNRPRPSTQRAGPNKGRELPRCIISYLKRIADERMLQESLSELESEWFITLERQDQKYHSSDAEDSEFLRTFEKQRSDIWKDLNNAQMDVNSLRLVCIEQGHTDFDYEDLSSLNLFRYDGEHILEPSRDPLKLGLEEEFLYLSGNEAPDQDFDIPLDLDLDTSAIPPSGHIRYIPKPDHKKSQKSAEFVNQWMLHKLRVSSMGIWHLQHLHIWGPLRTKGWEDYDISRYVLDRWYFDDAALAPLSASSYYGEGVSVIAPATKHTNCVKSRTLSPSSQ
jgi:FtsZ-binding cell division protein ZapB